MNTPETDNLARGNHVVPTEWAEQLERERDEAIRQLNNIKATEIHTCHDQCKRPMCILRRERDEARDMVEKLTQQGLTLMDENRSLKRQKKNNEGRKTPETDGAERMAFSQEYMVPTKFARKLERERDNARLELKGCKAKNKRISAELLVKITDIERERDEWAKLCGQYKQERDEARYEIKGLIPKK